MKSYTDLGQGRELAKILRHDSADMCYGIDDDTLKYNDLPWLIPYHKYTAKEYYVPCWSLSALLGVIPDVSLNSFKDGRDWNAMVQHDGRMIYVDKENPVDACVELIFKLKNMNLL